MILSPPWRHPVQAIPNSHRIFPWSDPREPPVNTSLLDGELAWRQHDGGHEDRSNMKHFITWANKLLKHTPPSPVK